MPTARERLPAFTEKDYQPTKMRQLVAVLERWYTSIENQLASAGGSSGSSVERSMSFFLGR